MSGFLWYVLRRFPVLPQVQPCSVMPCTAAAYRLLWLIPRRPAACPMPDKRAHYSLQAVPHENAAVENFQWLRDLMVSSARNKRQKLAVHVLLAEQCSDVLLDCHAMPRSTRHTVLTWLLLTQQHANVPIKSYPVRCKRNAISQTDVGSQQHSDRARMIRCMPLE